jgi:2-methylcitrate dehydratase PrpD
VLVAELAAWAVDTYRRGAVPEPVLRLAEAQRKSVFAALAAGLVHGAAPVPALAASEEGLFQAVDAAAALDFDDYLCFGHAGLSSVLTASMAATLRGVAAPGHDQVAAAQVIASELHARIAGACLLGPHGPTQWAYAHAVSAAAASGLLMGLDADELSHALAIALAQPAVPARVAFFGPDTRSLAVANATVLGFRAARLAGAGRTGPLRILDDRAGGVFSVLVRRALPEMLSGLGSGWALHTLSVKTTPTCSYVDPVLDALRALMPLAAEDIDRIDVAASLPTALMTRLAERYLCYAGLTPSTVAFSVPLSTALLLHAGELTPRQLTSAALRRDEDAVRRLASRIRVRHNPLLTRRLLGSLSAAFPVHQTLLRRLPGAHGRPMSVGPAQLWSPDRLLAFRMSFPIRLTIRLRDGSRLSAVADVPDGAAGSPGTGPREAAAAKFATWADQVWGTPLAGRLRHALEKDAGLAWPLVSSGAVAIR